MDCSIGRVRRPQHALSRAGQKFNLNFISSTLPNRNPADPSAQLRIVALGVWASSDELENSDEKPLVSPYRRAIGLSLLLLLLLLPALPRCDCCIAYASSYELYEVRLYIHCEIAWLSPLLR